jgi:hypothetical protein
MHLGFLIVNSLLLLGGGKEALFNYSVEYLFPNYGIYLIKNKTGLILNQAGFTIRSLPSR